MKRWKVGTRLYQAPLGWLQARAKYWRGQGLKPTDAFRRAMGEWEIDADLAGDARMRTTSEAQFQEYVRSFPLNDPRD